MQKNILIITPERQFPVAYFIQSQIDLIQGNKFVLHDSRGHIPTASLNRGKLANQISIFDKVKFGLKRLLNKNSKYSLYCIERYIKDNAIDVVVAQYGPTGAKLTSTLRKLNVPLIVHFHGYDAYMKSVLDEFRTDYNVMFDSAFRILAVSVDMVEQLKRLGAPESKIVLNPYGPKSDFYSISPNYNSNNFLFAGRFVDKKAPYYLILAFANILNQCPDARLILIGDGPLLYTSQNLVRYFNLGNNVSFLGSLTHEEVIDQFKNAFCYVQHSVIPDSGDSEGTPNSVLEASIAGLPVISTLHAGIKDVILNNKTGFLVNEHDVLGMSQLMIKLYQDRGLAEEMGSLGKNHIKQNFSIDRYIQTINKIIEDV